MSDGKLESQPSPPPEVTANDHEQEYAPEPATRPGELELRSLEKKGEMEAVEALLDTLIFRAGKLSEIDGGYRLRVEFDIPNSEGEIVSDFHDCFVPADAVAESSAINRFRGFEMLNITRAELKIWFGIEINGQRGFKRGENDMISWRFRIIDGNGDMLTLGVYNKDQWVNGHSHRSYTEGIYLLSGTFILVTEDATKAHPRRVYVESLTRIDGGYVRVEFAYDLETQNIIGATSTAWLSLIEGEHQILETRADRPHNAFMSGDAVAGAVKRKKRELSEGEPDWSSEESFDQSLVESNNDHTIVVKILDELKRI